MMVFGLPSARISASARGRRQRAQGHDEVGDPAPRDEQTVDDARRPRRPRGGQRRRPECRPSAKTTPKTTAPSVIADAIDRSMPAVATTKV